MSTPQTNAPEWAAAQETPWLTENYTKRIFDAFAVRSIIEDRDLTAPPVSCDDGARYLIDSPATGIWAGRDGQMAIAFGEDAASGWVYAQVGREGAKLYIRDETLTIAFVGGIWITDPEGVDSLPDLSDVSIIAPQDGDILVYEASTGLWMAQQPAVASVYSDAQARAAVPVSLPISFLPKPTASEVLLFYTFIEAVDFAANFAGSAGDNAINATASTVFTVYKNPTFTADLITGGTAVGTITYSTGGAFTFATTGGIIQSFVAGDSIGVAAPSSVDATATGTFTLKGLRS